MSILLSVNEPARAQQSCQFQDFAGVPQNVTGDGAAATSAYLLQPHAVSVDPAGNLYIADTYNQRIRRVSADGIITTVAGTGTQGSGGDGGPATAASLALPQGVLAAPDGSVYIADSGNNRIRRVDSTGVIATVAGTGHPGFSGDEGLALKAELKSPGGMALHDGSLYFADTNNDRIRRIDSAGNISTIAGSHNLPSSVAYGGDGGPAVKAHLQKPGGLAVGPDGAIYIADTGNFVIRLVSPDGTIKTIAGAVNGSNTSKYPAPASTPLNWAPGNVVLLADGSLLIPALNLVRLTPDGATQELFGSVTSAYVAVDASGKAYVSGLVQSDRVMRISQAGATPENYAGQERFGAGGDGDLAVGPVLHSPTGMTTGPDGALYVADYENKRILKIQNGTIRKVASATGPTGVAVDSAGNLFIADYAARLVRKVTPGGVSSIVAGGGRDVPPIVSSTTVSATSVSLYPAGVIAHPNGNLYVASYITSAGSANQALVARVTPDGQLTTLLNFGQTISGLPVLSLSPFRGIAWDSSGNLLIPRDPLSNGSQVIRIDPDGRLLPVALPGSVLYDSFVGIAGAPSGALYLANSQGQIKQMLPDGNFATLYNRQLDQYLGPSTNTVFSSGLAIGATSLAADSEGNLYVAQGTLHRILKLPVNSCSLPAEPRLVSILPTPGPSRNGNAATYAPGELVSLYGVTSGPTPGATASLDANGRVPTRLAGTRVLFEGVPGPILYSGVGQVNSIVPFTMYGRSQVRVQLEYNGVLSDAYTIPLQETAPSLFASPSGGPPFVINPDGTVNSPSSPAPAGSVVLLYATGMGRMSPDAIDGSLGAIPVTGTAVPVTVDPPLSVFYAGDAPGIVEGVVQINVQLPATPLSTNFTLTSGDYTTTFYVASK